MSQACGLFFLIYRLHFRHALFLLLRVVDLRHEHGWFKVYPISWLPFSLLLIDRNQYDGLDFFIFLQLWLLFLWHPFPLLDFNIIGHEFRQLLQVLFNLLTKKSGWLRHTYTLAGLFLVNNCRYVYGRFELAHFVLVRLVLGSICDSSGVAAPLQKTALMCLVLGKLSHS